MRSYLSDDADLIRSQVPAGSQPPPESDELFVLYAVLMRAKGEAVTAADVHDAWAAWILTREGAHKSLLPFEQLDAETQRQDYPYVEAIRRAARFLAKTPH